MVKKAKKVHAQRILQRNMLTECGVEIRHSTINVAMKGDHKSVTCDSCIWRLEEQVADAACARRAILLNLRSGDLALFTGIAEWDAKDAEAFARSLVYEAVLFAKANGLGLREIEGETLSAYEAEEAFVTLAATVLGRGSIRSKP